VTSVGRVVNFPPFPEVPEFLRGRSFVVVEIYYLGDEADGARLIAPLRELAPEIDLVATVPAPALSHLHMDPEEPVPGKGDGMLLNELPPAAIDALVGAATGEAGAALLSVEVRHLGGAISRPAPEHGALAAIDAPYVMFAVGAAPTPELRAIVEAQVTGVKDALGPWNAAYGYLNFAERPVETRALHAEEYTYRRLQAIKSNYDPSNMIQANHPIGSTD
ncbi:MAG: FAD-binding oxidoreductase, partial [Solirubrobacteraceae bacterium]